MRVFGSIDFVSKYWLSVLSKVSEVGKSAYDYEVVVSAVGPGCFVFVLSDSACKSAHGFSDGFLFAGK